MSSGDTIFREYRISDAERSDRSAGDRLRHRQKVRESIRENIADIIAEESIIGKDKDRVIKVPLRGIKEYRFVYGDNAPGASQGDGDAQPGQVVGKTGKDGPGKGDEQAGDRPGVDYYETDVTLEELIEIMFEDLELPNLERRALREIQSDYSSRRKGYRQVGIRIRLDKRRTAKQRVMRMLASDKRSDAVGARAGRIESRPRDAERPRSKARSTKSRSKKAGLTKRRWRLRTGAAFQRVPPLPVPSGRPALQARRDRHPGGIERRRHLHHGYLGLDGHDEEVPGAQLLLPALSVHLDPLPQRRNRFHRASHRGQRGHRGRVLPQGRIGRHLYLVGLRRRRWK